MTILFGVNRASLVTFQNTLIRIPAQNRMTITKHAKAFLTGHSLRLVLSVSASNIHQRANAKCRCPGVGMINGDRGEIFLTAVSYIGVRLVLVSDDNEHDDATYSRGPSDHRSEGGIASKLEYRVMYLVHRRG